MLCPITISFLRTSARAGVLKENTSANAIAMVIAHQRKASIFRDLFVKVSFGENLLLYSCNRSMVFKMSSLKSLMNSISKSSRSQMMKRILKSR